MWWILALSTSFAARYGPPVVEVEIELLRPDGKSFAVKPLTDPADGAQVVVPDGDLAWMTRLTRSEYEGRLEICATVSEWGIDGESRGMTETCVVLPGRDTPSATTVGKAQDVQIRLTVERRKRP